MKFKFESIIVSDQTVVNIDFPAINPFKLEDFKEYLMRKLPLFEFGALPSVDDLITIQDKPSIIQEYPEQITTKEGVQLAF